MGVTFECQDEVADEPIVTTVSDSLKLRIRYHLEQSDNWKIGVGGTSPEINEHL